MKEPQSKVDPPNRKLGYEVQGEDQLGGPIFFSQSNNGGMDSR
jgi:hypothetical protein